MNTSFRNIFRSEEVESIEIPRIQRDYAHGRKEGGVTRIRRAFLQVLHGALTGGDSVHLDFIYGEIEGKRMIPLDGQQRLTTLFLLHWYLAARNGVDGAESNFLDSFTYETRYSSMQFCEKLVVHQPAFPLVGGVSEWLTDQSWYAGAWKHDPTIQAMLVVLDDIHGLFASASDADCRAAWNKLVDRENPAISFESLSLPEMGLTDEIYIRMNSRGRPLTPFEYFKAVFGRLLKATSEEYKEDFVDKKNHYEEFIHKVDIEWSDLLWPLRNSNLKNESDDVIDDEFLRLFRFLTEIVVYRQGLPADLMDDFDEDINKCAERVYGLSSHNPLAALRTLFDALNTLFAEFGAMKSVDEIADWFADYFTEKGYRPGAVAIFDEKNLFGDCCANYGVMYGFNRAFSLSRTLLLFGVLEYLMAKPRPLRQDFVQLMRTLRNLVFAWDNEITGKNFRSLLNETADYMGSGDLTVLSTYNKRQIAEEWSKAAFLNRHPDHIVLQETLHRLEDHDLLRGCLAAFDLDVEATTFIRRAELFHQVFTEDDTPPVREISAALLASGNYSQRLREGRFLFGTPETNRKKVWRRILTGADILQTRKALMKMLDDMEAASGASMAERLNLVSRTYLSEQEKAKCFNWRYYLVKYPEMRSGSSGLYISSSLAMGFDLCMMKEMQLNGAYRDPYLLAVIELSGAKQGEDVKELKHSGWDCYTPEGRWIEFLISGERVMSCRSEGFQLLAPTDSAELLRFKSVCQKHGLQDDLMLKVPQVIVGGEVYDTEDRIQAGANLLKDLIPKAKLGPTINNSALASS